MRFFTRKRRIRLHFADDSPSIDGIYLGTTAGHYVLVKGTIIGEQQLVRERVDVALDGETWIPRERVLFAQVTP